MRVQPSPWCHRAQNTVMTRAHSRRQMGPDVESLLHIAPNAVGELLKVAPQLHRRIVTGRILQLGVLRTGGRVTLFQVHDGAVDAGSALTKLNREYFNGGSYSPTFNEISS